MDEGAMKRQYAKELAAEMFARRHGIVPRRKPPDHEAKLRWARVRVCVRVGKVLTIRASSSCAVMLVFVVMH